MENNFFWELNENELSLSSDYQIICLQFTPTNNIRHLIYFKIEQ